MGFATGFNAGWGAVSDTVKEYERLKQKREFEAAQKEKEFQKYTPQQGEFLRGLGSETVNVGGEARPRYQFDIDPGSTNYRVREILYPDAPTRTEGMSFGGPMYEEAAAPAPRSREEIARMYAVGTPYDGPVDLKGEPIYPPDVAMGSDAGRGLTARDTGISRPANTVSPRPEDSGLYSQLLNRYGETVTMTPGATEYLGKTYEGGLSASQRDAALMNRYADIIAKDNPMEAMKLRAMAKQEERAQAGEQRAAELFTLQKQGAQQNIDVGKLDIETKGFALDDVKKSRSLTEWMAANPQATTKDIFAKADELKISTKARSEVIQQLTGISQGELDLVKTQITKDISGMNRKQLLEAHKNNPNITPGAHYEEVVDKKGNVALFLVDTNTGKRLTEKPDFSGSAAEVDKYLRTAATDPATLLDYTMNLRKTKADISAKEASTVKDLGMAQYYATGGGLNKTSFDIVGMDKDNQPILFDKRSGKLGREDGKPIQDVDWAKKFAGAGATAVSKQEEIAYREMLNSDAWERARTDADKAKVMRKYNLDPTKFGMTGIPGGGWND